MKPFLLNLSQVTISVKRFFLIPIFLLAFYSVHGQNAIVGTGFSTGWGGGSCPTGNGNFKFLAANVGTTWGVTTTASGAGAGERFFRFGVDWGGTTTQLTITSGSDVFVAPNTKYSLNTTCTTSGSMKYNVPNTSYNYVFKTLNAGTNPTGTFVFFEVQGAVQSVISVTQSPVAASVTACQNTIVTANLSGALATGQAVYLRYTNNSYSTSTVIPLTGSGTTYTATIPSSINTAGAAISYYVFTSGTATPSGSDADLYTINLNNNGSNYNYTVGAATTTTWNGTSWSNCTPTALIDAIIDGTYSTTTNGAITAKKLTVNSGKSLTINAGTNVTVQNDVINNGSLVVESNANLIQVNNVANTGAITVNRNSSPLFRLDFTIWSSPVSGSQTLGNFSPLTATNRFYEYDTSLNLYSAVSNGIPFGLAKGYLIRMPNEDPANLGLGTPYYIGNSALTYNGVFAGTPNNGDITYTMSTVGNGYNAVGNPYPSTLNMDNFISGNSSNITGPLYFWRKKNNVSNLTSYSTCTTAGCTLTNSHTYPNGDYISVGQGFIVKALTTTLNFTNSMRIADNTNQFFKTKAIEKNRIWLNLSDANSPINQMMVAYMTGATQGIDAAIDGTYFNDSQTALNSLIGNEEYAIQGRSLPFAVTDVVPLAFKTTTAGDYTIAIDRVDGLFASGQDIYLVDSKTGAETNLKTSSYNFTAASGIDNTRFSLKYQKTLKVDDVIFNENNVTVYAKNGSLYVNSGEMAISTIQVYDVQGRLLAERKNVKATTATLDNLKANNQVLLVKVVGENNQAVTKKVVN